MPAAPKIDFREWQEHLDFLLPHKELLRPDEVAGPLRLDEKSVGRLFDSAALHGHDLNASNRKRQQRLIRHDSVILLLADRANYTPEDLRVRLVSMIMKLSLPELVLLQAAIAEIIRRKRA